MTRRDFFETIPLLVAVPSSGPLGGRVSLLGNPDEPSPPAQLAERYKATRRLIGYPQFTVERIPETGRADWLQTLRLRAVSYGNLTKAEAAALAQEATQKGYNVLIAEKNRYLLHDPGEDCEPDESYLYNWGGPSFPELTRNAA